MLLRTVSESDTVWSDPELVADVIAVDGPSEIEARLDSVDTLLRKVADDDSEIHDELFDRAMDEGRPVRTAEIFTHCIRRFLKRS